MGIQEQEERIQEQEERIAALRNLLQISEARKMDVKHDHDKLVIELSVLKQKQSKSNSAVPPEHEDLNTLKEALHRAEMAEVDRQSAEDKLSVIQGEVKQMQDEHEAQLLQARSARHQVCNMLENALRIIQ